MNELLINLNSFSTELKVETYLGRFHLFDK